MGLGPYDLAGRGSTVICREINAAFENDKRQLICLGNA